MILTWNENSHALENVLNSIHKYHTHPLLDKEYHNFMYTHNNTNSLSPLLLNKATAKTNIFQAPYFTQQKFFRTKHVCFICILHWVKSPEISEIIKEILLKYT